MERARRRVLVIGQPTPANFLVLRALRAQELDVVMVRRQGEALARVTRGESPQAILLLDLKPDPECMARCDRPYKGAPDCIIDCIRSHHRSLEWVPVMVYSPEEGADPQPDELAAMIAAAAATNEAVTTRREA